MKAKRLFFLVMAICLASGVKAQFYDGPDDIYYYVLIDGNGNFSENGRVLVFNFDGRKAALLSLKVVSDGFEYDDVSKVKQRLKSDIEYYEKKIESTEYELNYQSGGYVNKISCNFYNSMCGQIDVTETHTYTFSADRNICMDKIVGQQTQTLPFFTSRNLNGETRYKKVDKSYFKVGRSRTPSGTMYE